MSCNSPFSLSETASEEYTYNLNLGGKATVPGYSIPGWNLCLLGWNPAHIQWGSCCLGGCVCHTWEWCKCCTQNNHCDVGWDSGSHYWYDCTPVPSIVLWPTISVDGAITCALGITADDGLEITANPPEGAIPAIELSISDVHISFGMSFNGETKNYSFSLPITVDINFNDGIPSILIPLGPPVTSQSTLNLGAAGSFTIEISLTFGLLFCLLPTPPQGWVNMQTQVDISGTYSIDGLDTAIDETATLVFPIISIED